MFLEFTLATSCRYGIAQAATRNLRLLKKNQCCLISGESGAGKTESAKYFVNNLLHFSAGEGADETLERQIIESGPLLEAFGNARTSLNDNSSRFGKYLEICYHNNVVVGARMSKYAHGQICLLHPSVLWTD